MTPLKTLVFLALVIVALLSFVVVVATIQGILNATAVIATLGSVLGGIVTGLVLKLKTEDGHDE